MATQASPFLFPGPVATNDSLAIIHLKRDLQIPVILRDHDEDDEGYAEGKVLNTRFGNFPHSTLIGVPWGSQVRASQVDTGTRGRRKKDEDLKRKREEPGTEVHSVKLPRIGNEHDNREDTEKPVTLREDKEAVTASSGFVHLLPPTPENWTSSLPHRTQVVYIPDYSYILHRLRARPGTRIIEAGAGSGSFTHASARAVFSGYPDACSESLDPSLTQKDNLGKVWSFEFHEQRYEKLRKEIQDHGLESIVQITHRDVCTDGFLIEEPCQSLVNLPGSEIENGQNKPLEGPCNPDHSKKPQTVQKSPLATAVFLDLPAPWLALPHLTRSPQSRLNLNSSESDDVAPKEIPLSPLDPFAPVHICTFSPCIEQVQRTISAMRHLGWVDINTVELSHRRYEVRRERIGLAATGAQRGLQMMPANVDEAVARLLEVEGIFKAYHERETDAGNCEEATPREKADSPPPRKKKLPRENGNRRKEILMDLVEGKSYKEGRLVHRAETEVKTHTSYLVFAVLPQEWSEADESMAREKWPLPSDGAEIEQTEKPMSRKAMKKAQKAVRRNMEGKHTEESKMEAEAADPVIDEDNALAVD